MIILTNDKMVQHLKCTTFAPLDGTSNDTMDSEQNQKYFQQCCLLCEHIETNCMYVHSIPLIGCIVYSIHFNIHSNIKKQQCHPLYGQISLLRVVNTNGSGRVKNSLEQIPRRQKGFTKGKSNNGKKYGKCA